MNIINLGILAHIDAGKTSVTENLLFASGATEKCGRVDNGDTITDSMDIEKRRGITVRASTTSIIWNGVKCNIIDTPGHMDFIAEVERTFKMLDGAVLILSAKEGIQAQTKLLFNTLQKLQIPTIIYILKSATYRVSWEFTCKTTKILLLYIFLGHNRNVVNTKFPYPIKRLEV
ncbi:MAG: GTP-binding protein, partial [Prevotella sp.]|nr:GTP-binding protein [Prevotella sp.]